MVTCRGNKLQTSINFVVEETSYAAPPLWLYAKSPTPFPLYSDRFISPCNSCSLHFCCKLQRHSFTLLPSVYSLQLFILTLHFCQTRAGTLDACRVTRAPFDVRVESSRCSHWNLDECTHISVYSISVSRGNYFNVTTTSIVRFLHRFTRK